MKIGLVLGAGGHPGYPFQLVVLDAIERRLKIDLREIELVSGTSVGAMTGLLLRAGFSVTDQLAIARGQEPSAQGSHLLHHVMDPPGQLPPALPPWRRPSFASTGPMAAWRLLSANGRRRHRVPAAAASLLPRGRASHDIIGRAADSLFVGVWPQRATWVVAMRTEDGGRTVFGRDIIPSSVGAAVTASSAIPGWFRPVEVDGHRHVDAGVRSTTNADLLATRPDLDLTIVVPPMAIDRPRTAVLDAPLRWLVNAQLRAELETLHEAGMRTLVARPTAQIAAAMQGHPIHLSPERATRLLDATSQWAYDWADASLAAPLPTPAPAPGKVLAAA
ncbi:MAG: NTE family protein [Glaciecola sp.]|jgi:NTE family protein